MAGAFDVDLSMFQLKQFQQQFALTDKEISKAIPKGMRKAAMGIQKVAKKDRPYKSRAKKLNKSISIWPKRDTLKQKGGHQRTVMVGPWTGQVENGRPEKVFYAHMVAGGTLKRPLKNKFSFLPGGPYIAVPLPHNLTNGGWPRKQELESLLKRPNPKGFIWKAKGQYFVAERREGRPPLPLFVLKKEVKTRPRPFMNTAIAKGKREFAKTMNTVITETLQQTLLKRKGKAA